MEITLNLYIIVNKIYYTITMTKSQYD